MGKPFKIVNNSSAGTADSVGGDDWDNAATYLNNQPDQHTYTYLIYIDPTSGDYYARNGQTGEVDFTHASDVANVLTSIIDSIPSPGYPTIIKLGPGDFNMESNFNNITSSKIGNIAIVGSGIGVTNLIATSSITSGNVVDVLGNVTGSSNNLTGNAAAGDITLAVTDGSVFTAGDTILLRSTAAFSAMSSAQGKKGEIHKIVSISTNTLTLDHWTHDAYATADTANVIKLAMLKNMRFEDFSLKAGAGYAGSGGNFFEFVFCDNLRINRVHVQNSNHTAFDLASCINFDCNVVIEQTADATFNSQYGFKPVCASENGRAIVTAIGRWRHAITIDASGSSNREGQVRNVVFSGTAETSDEAAFDTHATGENISFRNCHVQASRSGTAGTSDAKGFQMRAKKCNITGCSVWEGVGKGITLTEDASGSVISGCSIMRTRELPGNNTLGYGLEIRGGVNNCIVTGNQIEGSKREGILLRTSSSGHVITGNIINANGGAGINGTDVTNTVVSGNSIIGNSKAITMSGTCDYWVITGNSFRTNTSGSTIIGAGTVNANNTT